MQGAEDEGEGSVLCLLYTSIKTGGDKETWILETDVLDLYPLMAFYLSHAEYVEIIEGKGLREAAIEYVKKHLKL